MNPILLQKQLRDNSNDLQDFCKELKDWSSEMKRKEEALKSDDAETVSWVNLKVCLCYLDTATYLKNLQFIFLGS